MRKHRKLPTLETVAEFLELNEETGELICKQDVGKLNKAGDIYTRKPTEEGYLLVGIPGCGSYFAHRIIWLLHTGEDPGEYKIDHINKRRTDNRPCNLRKATHQQNIINRECKGYSVVTRGGKKRYRVVVVVNGKWEQVGVYDTPEEASAAHRAKRVEMHGDFANCVVE